MITIETGFKYAVFNTGYTGRLAYRDSLIKLRQPVYWEGVGNLAQPMFIKDELHGKGIYMLEGVSDEVGSELPVSDNIPDEVTGIISSIEGSGVNSNGIIAFRCDALREVFEIVEALKELDYCAMLNVFNIYKMNYIEEKGILVIHIDCESG